MSGLPPEQLKKDALLILLAGGFICPYSQPELHRQMRAEGFADAVRAALAPLGRDLGALGEDEAPEAYFARYVDLDDPRDRQQATAQLLVIRDQIRPCIDLIRLLDQASGNDSCMAPGEELSFAALLNAIEENPTFRDQLRDLAGHEFFAASRNGKDTKDKLGRVLKAMADAEYLVKRSSESSNYIITGRMGYLHHILGWLADHHRLSLNNVVDDPQMLAQRGLL